ncbi:hypothetical protein IW262DRAFT_558338 [Armillaria fumosa]|nr:hypothetical protein IW262DRAFT_558338 [Armillaria fumosa]
MSIPNIHETSNLDPGNDGTIVPQDAEAESQGIGGDGEHRHNSAEQEVETNEVAGGQEQDETPASAPPPSANAAGAKKVFGMKRSSPTVKKGNDTYDYEQKYPEDAIYEETAPNARVWRVHEDESRNHDANMVEESRDNVDVLLVFAGLFSAVVTTFVVQTSQSLQVDYAAMSASLLYESVLIQRAIANGSSVNSITPSPLNPTVAFVPATTDVWVNGLWFTSLFLSLTTALVAVLVKQWLHHYVALPSGTPRDRSLTRQFRYAGFQKWHVQVIIGLLPVLMHLALAIFLVGLVIFLRPLRQALSWVICAGTGLVYTAYVVATILPIIFPQCPYRTPLCDLIYISFRRIVPQVTWEPYNKSEFLSSYRQRDFKTMFRHLPCIRARHQQSLTTIESKFVQQTSTDLAPEALHWLFSVSSNPTVQSIVIQSIGGLPMASEEKCQALRTTMYISQFSLLRFHLQSQTQLEDPLEPVPGMELGLERLLRFDDSNYIGDFKISPNIDSFELDVAISFNNHSIVKDGAAVVSPDAFFISILSGSARASKLPPRCWFFLARRAALWGAFDPLDPDKDDHTNMFPLYLCSAILHSFHASPKEQDFNSPLVLDFNDTLPYILDKIYDNVLHMFSAFIKHPLLSEPSLPQSLKVIVVAIEFLLHRLSLPECNMSHTTICQSLTAAIGGIRYTVFSSQEATALIAALEDIITLCVGPLLNIELDWIDLCHNTIRTYHHLTTYAAPSACSLCGLQSIADFMISHWDQIGDFNSYKSDAACGVLTDLLEKRIPVAFTVFHESQCLPFLGSHIFHQASVPMVSAYVAGILATQQGSGGAVDAESLQQHIDCLYNTRNWFTTYSILATHGIEHIDRTRTAIHRDITALAQLCPRDTSWDEFHRKLDDLVQSEDGEFFRKQLTSPWPGKCHSLQADEIQAEKDNIRYATHVLDDFINGGGHTIVSPELSPKWHPIVRIHRFVGWHLGRKPGSAPEQGQQV